MSREEALSGLSKELGMNEADEAAVNRELDEAAAERAGQYGNVKEHPSANSGKRFTPAQKQKILAQNEAKNGGVLRDDRTGEQLVRPQQGKAGVTPPSNEANVDHVYPRSKGGPNTNSNAEVRGRANNIEKNDTLEDNQ